MSQFLQLFQRSPQLWGVLLISVAGPSLAWGDQSDVAAARQFFDTHCTECHGKVNPVEGLNVLDHSLLTSGGYIAAGNLEKSSIWARLTDESAPMPPDGLLPPEKVAVISKWITSGAPSFEGLDVAQRPFISIHEVLSAIKMDLDRQLVEDRPYVRYFTITHLHNNPSVSERDMRMFRAALSKLVNSMSWESQIVLPVSVDQHQTVFRVNLTELGWDESHAWRKMLEYYPYGLSYDSYKDREIRNLATDIYAATGTRLPFIRADWFVAAISVPPLYHDVLALPDGHHADTRLEAMLGVNFERDFLTGRLKRAGFIKSNVSNSNRLVDRHPSSYGAYWKSYDFASNLDRGNILDYPLGPEFPTNTYNREAFVHDGGEIVFHLPNGLQGYLITDGKGTRIDRAPVLVVRDKNLPLRNVEVINGISCMVCHKHGMQTFKDDLLSSHGVRASAAVKVERLVPPQEVMDQLVMRDKEQFMRALTLAVGPFLQIEEDAGKPIEKFDAEPIGVIAKTYAGELDLFDVAAELAIEDPQYLVPLFSNKLFTEDGGGLRNLSNGGVIQRENWDSLPKSLIGYSLYQKIAEKLEMGTPERVFPLR